VSENFGYWIKRVRARSGLSQSDFARLLGLESGQAIYQAEQKPDRRFRSDTLEALMDLLELAREEDLDAMWRSMKLPDRKWLMDRARTKLREVDPNGDAMATQVLAELDHALDIGTVDAGDVLAVLKSHGITTGAELARRPRAAASSGAKVQQKDEHRKKRKGA
jgi:transcriptional regulator with XRE-family HTH domain